MDYKQILEDIIELDERITVIRGFGDVIIDPSKARTLGYLPDEMIFKDLNYIYFNIDEVSKPKKVHSPTISDYYNFLMIPIERQNEMNSLDYTL